jgi:hypothetical protein
MSVGLPKQLRRLSAVVVVLCYVWLSAAGAFLHNCVRVHPSSESVVTQIAQADASQISDDSHLIEHAHINSAASCAVCDWQSVNVSVALPVFDLLPPFARQQRVITTFPRYLRTTVVSTSSRAPPLA